MVLEHALTVLSKDSNAICTVSVNAIVALPGMLINHMHEIIEVHRNASIAALKGF